MHLLYCTRFIFDKHVMFNETDLRINITVMTSSCPAAHRGFPARRVSNFCYWILFSLTSVS